MSIKIKICCIKNKQEAHLAIKEGAFALGLVSQMPSGPGVISDTQILDIQNAVGHNIETFLLTSETDTAAIIRHHQLVKTSTLQLVDALQKGTYQDLRTALPGVKLVQVIHVLDEASIEEALAVGGSVDYLLLDSGNPNSKVKVLGGTGKTHNWQISRKIVEQSSVPVFLAGGLRPDNVQRAIDEVQPSGLDLCSGVRTKGDLDPHKLKVFFKASWD